MSGSERDLVLALRAELAGIDPARDCDREAERAGLDLGERWRDATLARLAVRLARHSSGATPPPATFDWATRPEHCRMAWLRGRFLARGSLSLVNGRTHLELVLPPDEAPQVQRWLRESGISSGWRLRRGRGVVTLKSAEQVQILLRRLGAGASLLEIETRQVARTLRGDLNRVINAESANLARTVRASGRQLEAIEALSGDGRLAEESATVRAVASARRETPEATLGELADRLAIHRSAVQRALDRIERLALA
ncbi:MAG TPA: DNA-binding protein WhiA [Patescibacteria group bacterium]|nr:DNA-binding protein WhiA [Patescibacteria group bacterium]